MVDYAEFDSSSEAVTEEFPYQKQETTLGVWRLYYAEGYNYAEFRSHREWFGVPLVHITRGICPETDRRKTARGIIAIGRIAIGVLAIGQVAAGLIAIGQVAIGLLLGLGQATIGVCCVGQLALGGFFSLGQFTTGYITIGQFSFGEYVLAQFGLGHHVVDTLGADPEAEKFFAAFLS
jgi:hypothetical protein